VCLQETAPTEVSGTSSEQLGDADLAEATLPDTRLQRAGLTMIEETAKNLRQLFFALLGGCAYAGLTIVTTSHAQLLTNATSLELPLLRTSIPIVPFYAVAPVLILIVHLYLHCAMQRLWAMVADATATVADYHRLDKAVDLGLFRAMARVATRRVSFERRPLLFHLRTILWSPTVWVAPLTLLWFWLLYLPRHDWQGTRWHAFWVSGAIVSAGAFYWRTANLHSATLKATHWVTALVMAVIFAVMLFLSYLAIYGAVLDAAPWPSAPSANGIVAGVPIWQPPVFSFAGVECCVAQVEEAHISTKPPHWQPQYATAQEMQQAIELVAGASLAGSDLAFAHARRAFLAKADLRRATLLRADLFMAQLQGADLSHANLQGADLSWAYLQWADLSEALLMGADLQGANLSQGARLIRANLQGAKLFRGRLTNANISQANLQRADLSYSYLQEANLSSADLRLATLTGADLRAADFSDGRLDAADVSNTTLQRAIFARAHISGATFYGAQLQEASFARADVSGATFAFAQLHKVNLSSAKVSSANFSNAALPQADLSQADLSGANFQGADLWEANLTGANLQGANLQNVLGLTVEQVLRAEHWELACYGTEMLSQLNLEVDHNVAVRKRLEEEHKSIAYECVS
jgi:uncharacterized protein YjbI with pentapeptide repeats